MAFNSYFPATYQPFQAAYPQIPQQPSQPVSNGIIWVQGEAGAKSYLVAPNNTVQLWDSESQVIYLKSADASGMPSMKVLDYTIRGSTTPSDGFSAPSNENIPYATKDALNAIQSEIDVLRAEVERLTAKKKKEGLDDE